MSDCTSHTCTARFDIGDMHMVSVTVASHTHTEHCYTHSTYTSWHTHVIHTHLHTASIMFH